MSRFKDVTGQIFNVSGVELEAIYYEKINGRTKWILSCRKCEEEDKELWYLGSITSTLSYLRKGVIPCGCSKSPHYTKDQKVLLANRYAWNYNYEVVSVADGNVNRAALGFGSNLHTKNHNGVWTVTPSIAAYEGNTALAITAQVAITANMSARVGYSNVASDMLEIDKGIVGAAVTFSFGD